MSDLDRHEREFIAAAAGIGALTLLALVLEDSAAIKRLDRGVRRVAGSSGAHRADRILAPLFPLGLPGAYIPIAHAAAWWLGNRGQRSWRIPATAWTAWLAHRGVKLVYHRERPRGRTRDGARKPLRMDSYPSGHTTGVTAMSVALLAALALYEREAPRARHPRLRRAALPLVAAAPFVMGIQRILADDHWASDVLGGLALGTAAASACDAIAEVTGGRFRRFRR